MVASLGNGLETIKIVGFLLLTLAAHCFNIDTANTTIFTGSDGSEFGARVVQFADEQGSWIGVSGRDEAGSGTFFRCIPGSSSCIATNVTEFANSSALLTIGATPTKVVICDPNIVQTCVRNSWTPGACYSYGTQLNARSQINTEEKKCIPETVDVVFLFDGSNSLTKRDLDNNKQFMLKMMEQADSGMQFAIVQYAFVPRTEMDFKTFQTHRSNLRDLVEKIKLMESSTRTAAGINFTIFRVFTEEAGARKEAARLLIVITDGETSPGDDNLAEVINKTEGKRITRCVIGVGTSFEPGSRGLRELELIASSPRYLIKVRNYNELESVFQDLKSKIYKIEGTQAARNETSFEMEMAQTGFSVLLTKDSIVLGAVGAYDWSGGLVEIKDSVGVFINVSKNEQDMKDAYLGYSVKEAMYRNRSLYVVGAPRYQHKGKVIVFDHGDNDTRWEPRQHLLGEQIGSYFGSEICTLDLTGDGQTDLLLIGSPLYYRQGHGGMVTVCALSPEGSFSCPLTLRGILGEVLGRFGSTIAGLRDMDGDGLADVAVGAPLEDDHRGSLYIYQGRPGGVEEQYSQRITGRQVSPALKYFGQSVQGTLDMTGDGLTDMAVGASGNAVLLHSRPVVNVSVEMRFEPGEIGLEIYRCPWSSSAGERLGGNARVCFTLTVMAPRDTGPLSLNLTYRLDLEGSRQVARAELRSRERPYARSLTLSTGTQCVQHPILLPACIEDSLTPIELGVTFSLTDVPIGDGDELQPILSHRCPRTLTGLLPMESSCGEDDVCVDHLNINFKLGWRGTLVLGRTTSLDLTVILENQGEDSYNTMAHISHPQGLSLRRVKEHGHCKVECTPSREPIADLHGIFTCNVSHPIFRQNKTASFGLTLDISGDPDWGEEASFAVEAHSNNKERITINSAQKMRIPVIYAVKVIVTSLPTTRYIRFSGDDQQKKNVVHTYKVENLGSYTVPLSISFSSAVTPLGLVSWGTTIDVADIPVDCRNISVTDPSPPRDSKEIHVNQVWTHIECQYTSIKNSVTTFNLRGFANLLAEPTTETPGLVLMSRAELSLNRSLFVSDDWELSQQAEVLTEVHINPQSKRNLQLYSAFSGLLLLLIIFIILWKVGFFKRKSQDSEVTESEKMINKNGNADAGSPANDNQPSANYNQPPTNDNQSPASDNQSPSNQNQPHSNDD